MYFRDGSTTIYFSTDGSSVKLSSKAFINSNNYLKFNETKEEVELYTSYLTGETDTNVYLKVNYSFQAFIEGDWLMGISSINLQRTK